MARRIWGLLALVLLATPSFALAQTVQLPTFRQFSVSTTVSVPDGGRMVLGGHSRAYEAEPLFGYERGPLDRSRYSGRSTSAATVGVDIHDLDELERRVLGRAAEERRPVDEAISRRASELTRRFHLQRPDVAGTRSVAEWQRKTASAHSKRIFPSTPRR